MELEELTFLTSHYTTKLQSSRQLKKERTKVRSLSHVLLFVTTWMVAYQAPLSMGFSRQKYWNGLPFHSFACSCPVFIAPFIEEAAFAPLHILASFVINKVPIGPWVYLWAFYLVRLVYISVFVPVPYYLDDCSFIV